MTSIKAKKVILKNRAGEHLIPVVDGGGGTLNMFDTVLKDHILTYEESKGLALQGTYVYKEAIAGSRYGYSTFYEKCVEEFQNASNTKQGLKSNIEKVGSIVDNKGALSGFTDTSYAKLPQTFNPTTAWEAVFKFNLNDVSVGSTIFCPWNKSYYGIYLRVSGAKLIVSFGNGSTTSAFSIGAIYGTSSILANRDYWVKVEFTGTTYNLYLSATGLEFTLEGSLSSTANVACPNVQAIGINYWGSGYADVLQGSVDLNECYINVAGQRWWTGAQGVIVNPNGHKFYDINSKDFIDEYFDTTGRAWFYGVDTENERIFLPRNSKYFRIGDKSTVGTNQDAGLPTHTHTRGTMDIKGNSALVWDSNSEFGMSGAFYKGNNSTQGVKPEGGATNAYRMYYQASRNWTGSTSAPDNDIYGNSDTVELDSVNMLLYICVGNTEAEEAITDVTEITTSENDTLPWGYHFYSGELLEAPVGYIESLGQWNDGSDLYAQFFSKAVNKLGEAFAGGYIKEVTEEYDDYDLVINQADMTFRLPLLDGSEDLLSDKFVGLTLKASGSSYTAPANGWVVAGGKSTAANQYVVVASATISRLYSNATGQALRTYIPITRGDAFSLSYSMDIDTFKFIYAQGNGSLYFKVANAVQNLELLNAGEVLEAVNNVNAKVEDINAKVDNTVHIVETYQNGASWYRVYSDGWCEQGGKIVVNSGSVGSGNYSTAALTFMKPFSKLMSWHCQARHDRFNAGFSLTTVGGAVSNVTVYQVNDSGGSFANEFVLWQACGYIA